MNRQWSKIYKLGLEEEVVDMLRDRKGATEIAAILSKEHDVKITDNDVTYFCRNYSSYMQELIYRNKEQREKILSHNIDHAGLVELILLKEQRLIEKAEKDQDWRLYQQALKSMKESIALDMYMKKLLGIHQTAAVNYVAEMDQMIVEAIQEMVPDSKIREKILLTISNKRDEYIKKLQTEMDEGEKTNKMKQLKRKEVDVE